MKTVFEHIREKLHAQAGLVEPRTLFCNFETLCRTQWSTKFEQLMRNRLIMGGLRYGLLKSINNYYPYVQDAINRLQKYNNDGNDEHLVDAANLCLCEFIKGSHPNKHFNAKDRTK